MAGPSPIAVPAADQPKIGVHSIDHYALNIPDLDEGRRFYETFGLRTEKRGDHVALRARGDHVWGRLHPADRRSLRSLTFNCHDRDFDALHARIAEHPDAAKVVRERDDALTFDDFDGNRIRVQIGSRTTPEGKEPPLPTDRPDGARGATYRRNAEPVRPRRLAHVLIFSTDVERSVRFYAETLGLGLSDQSEGVVAFLHAIHGSDHHVLAFAKSEAPGFHHSSWDVDAVTDVGLGAMRMAEAGWDKGWGFGRHVLGSNFFHYVQDPWGSFAEYSCDIDFIPEGHAWDGGEHPAEDSLYLWGPEVPDIFLTNYEVDPPVGPAADRGSS